MTDEHTDTDTRSGDGDRHRTAHLEMDGMDLTIMNMTKKKTTTAKKTATPLRKSKVWVVRHTNMGTPERGEIHSIYTSKRDALKRMEVELREGYDATMQDNEDCDYEMMYISEETLYTPVKA